MKNIRGFYLTIILLLVSILVLNGCNRIISNSKIKEQNINVDGYEAKITELEEIIAGLKNENQDLNKTIDDLSFETHELGNNYKYYLNNYYYNEDSIQTMLGYRHYNGEEPLRALPYSDAIEVNSGFPGKVNVISTVRNKFDEHWALVELPDSEKGRNNYGFIKVQYIEEYKDTGRGYSELDIPISIESIKIGDLLEKAIVALGIDYIEMRANERGFIHYGETSGSGKMMIIKEGADIFYDLVTHNIWLIRVSKKGYYTSEGYGVGSNAKEAIDYYKKKFPMNGEVNFDKNAGYWSFDVGYDYVLKFEIDTKKLVEESIITRLELAPKWSFSY